MKNLFHRAIFFAILLALAPISVSYAGDGQQPFEMAGRQAKAIYLGEKTTAELNDNSFKSIPGMDFSIRSEESVLTPLLEKGLWHSLSSETSKPDKKHVFHPGLNFTASTVSNSPAADKVIPPNLNGWVGEEQYILMSYQYIRSFNKKTGKPDGILHTNSDSFFGGGSNDVRIDYDRFAKRWYFSCEVNNSVDLLLVVSSDGVITNNTTWAFYLFPNAMIIPQITPPGSGSLDYQQLAVDKHAVYIDVDTFDSSNNFAGTSSVVIQKKSLLAANPSVTVFPGLDHDFLPPADNFDKHPKYGYLITARTGVINNGDTDNQLFFYRIVNPQSTNPTIVGPIDITVGNYTVPNDAPHLGNLYGTSGYLQPGPFGALEAPHVRKGQLFACHTCLVDSSGNSVGSSGDRDGVRWYQLDVTGDPTGNGQGDESPTTVPVLIQTGTLYDPSSTSSPKYFFIPSIMTNKRMDLVIEATVAGANDYTNVAIATRKKNDPHGQLRAPQLLTKNTTNPYNFGPLLNASNSNNGQRWGDESSLAPDPCHDLDIWSTGEWAAVENGWGIQVTQLKGKRKARDVSSNESSD